MKDTDGLEGQGEGGDSAKPQIAKTTVEKVGRKKPKVRGTTWVGGRRGHSGAELVCSHGEGPVGRQDEVESGL